MALARVTYPGSVVFAPKPPPAPANAPKPAADAPAVPVWLPPVNAKGKPLRVVRNADKKGAFKSTTVTVPKGKRLTYTLKPAPVVFGGTMRPTFVVTMSEAVPAEVVHADLEHVPATAANPAHVIATSTKHAEDGKALSAVGSSASDAVKFLAAAVKTHLAKTAAADADAKKKSADAEAAADVAAELHNSKPPPAPKEDGETVTRHG